jgi:hypothetical protein
VDFKLTTGSRNDLDIAKGKLSFVVGVEAVAQKVRMKLQAFVGESVYKRLGGTPWLQPGNDGDDRTIYIFENTSDIIGNTRFILTKTIEDVDGVVAVLEMIVVIDRATRVVQVDGSARADDGEEFQFSVAQLPGIP